MNYSAPLLLRSRCVHHQAVWSKARPLFREETSPNQRQRNSAGSSASVEKSSKKHSKFDFKNKKLVRNKPNDKAADEGGVLDKSNMNIRKRFRKTDVEINEVTAEKMVLYKDRELCCDTTAIHSLHGAPILQETL